MEDDRFLELLLREAESLLTQEEKQQLHAWIEASDTNRTLAEKVRNSWESTRRPMKEIPVDLDQEYERLTVKIRSLKTPVRSLHFKGWQIAATILLLVGFVWYSSDMFFNSGRKMEIFRGPLANQVLDDGSIIWLSENSVFEFANQVDARKATLTGKGYFEIAQDLTKPFEISTLLGQVTVLGTAFEIDMTMNNAMTVSVSEGKVRLSNSFDQTVELIRGEKGFISGATLQKSIEYKPLAVWRLEPLTFNQETLGVILEQIKLYYPVNFEIENSTILQCKLSLTLTYPDIEDLISILETLIDIRFVKKEETAQDAGQLQFTISGEGCN